MWSQTPGHRLSASRASTPLAQASAETIRGMDAVMGTMVNAVNAALELLPDPEPVGEGWSDGLLVAGFDRVDQALVDVVRH